mmetsp:Transcript_4361/g.11011  ORF Transcript_4361/g.11011 Transcript_4361/m.11011 type:complete len:269 (-) Transcript_4361:376-1182(-)
MERHRMCLSTWATVLSKKTVAVRILREKDFRFLHEHLSCVTATEKYLAYWRAVYLRPESPSTSESGHFVENMMLLEWKHLKCCPSLTETVALKVATIRFDSSILWLENTMQSKKHRLGAEVSTLPSTVRNQQRTNAASPSKSFGNESLDQLAESPGVSCVWQKIESARSIRVLAAALQPCRLQRSRPCSALDVSVGRPVFASVSAVDRTDPFQGTCMTSWWPMLAVDGEIAVGQRTPFEVLYARLLLATNRIIDGVWQMLLPLPVALL